MTVALDRSETADRALDMRIADVKSALAKRNPSVAPRRIDRASRLVATLGEAVLNVPAEQQALLLENKEEFTRALRRALMEIVEGWGARAEPVTDPAERIHLQPRRFESSAGAGLGRRITRK